MESSSEVIDQVQVVRCTVGGHPCERRQQSELGDVFFDGPFPLSEGGYLAICHHDLVDWSEIVREVCDESLECGVVDIPIFRDESRSVCLLPLFCFFVV